MIKKVNWPLIRNLTKEELKELNKQLKHFTKDIKLDKNDKIVLDLKYKPVIYKNLNILREIYIEEDSPEDLIIYKVILRSR